MRNSWDSIPTQSQSDYAKRGEAASSYHQPLAYDARDRHNGKAGRAGSFLDGTQNRVKTRKGNTVMGGQRVREFEAYPGLSPVYENPLDRVFRDGKWQEISELNAKTWAAKKQERRNGCKNKRK